MKTTKETSTTKKKPLVLGRYRQNTAIAKAALILADGKKHTLGQIASRVKGVKDLKYRIQRLRIHGKKSHKWTVTREGDIFQMKVAKGVLKPTAARKTRPAAPKKVTPTTTAATSVAA